MPAELHEKGRQRVAANKRDVFGDPDFKTPDEAVVLHVIPPFQN